MTTTATQRIVVQATVLDKQAIVAKAKKLQIPISELMRRGAFAYQSDESDDALGALADAAKAAAERSAAAIDDALDFIELSNQRIAAMEVGSGARGGSRSGSLGSTRAGNRVVKPASASSGKDVEKTPRRAARVAQRKAV